MIKKKITSFRPSELQSSTSKMNDKKAMRKVWIKSLPELRSNENVNNYECLLKRMLYCPGNEQELLSALGVSLKCHAFNVFLVLKELLPKLEALSKSLAWLLDQALLAILEPLAAVLMFLKCSFLGILKALPVFPIYHHEQFVRGILLLVFTWRH